MPSKQTSRLTSSLIARKGEAAPVKLQEVHGDNEPTPTTVLPVPVSIPVQSITALTVKIDRERYERLKIYGVRNRRTIQDIMVRALDEYLERQTTP